MAGGGGETTLENTPTYSAAIAVAFFIGVSLLVERLIHRLKKHLGKKDQKPLKRVVDKLTDADAFGLHLPPADCPPRSTDENLVTNDFASHMLPCKDEDSEKKEATPDATAHRRLLASLINAYDSRRFLAAGASDYCERKGKAPFVSLEGLHQLHIFIFVLGFTHVTYSLISVLLGLVRMYHWKDYEAESQEIAKKGEITIAADLERRVCDKINGKGHGCGFLNRHIRRYENPVTLWILCFFQQFVASVSTEDYLLFRVSFISSFGLVESFNFRDYIMRSMEIDFKSVIGISWWLWAFVVVFLLLNADGLYTYFWASFIPTILVLIIGAKQQHIISILALQAKRHAQEVMKNQQNDTEEKVETRTNDTAGGNDSDEQQPRPKHIGEAVKPSDDLFWFQQPRVLLKLIHFVIFQNSFELAILFWILVTFGWNSCMLGHHTLVIIRITVGAATIFLSSYSILPIYALVTQMGSHMKMEAVLGKKAAKGVNSLIQRVRVKSGSGLNARGGDRVGPSVDSIPEDEPHTPSLRTRMEDAGVRRFQELYGKQKGLERLYTYKIQPRQQNRSSEDATS